MTVPREDHFSRSRGVRIGKKPEYENVATYKSFTRSAQRGNTMQSSACNVERSKYLQTADSSSLAVEYKPFNNCILIYKQ
jgi:hypothetical protein